MVTDSNQTLAENYYTRGRHNNISCIYLSPTRRVLVNGLVGPFASLTRN